ncbi:hypothetical protein GOP47_0026284 [Adiantum capillus-veneris]|nr:hypothetical protein GOP47_0026284 [Adiantum capillus-veneris]
MVSEQPRPDPPTPVRRLTMQSPAPLQLWARNLLLHLLAAMRQARTAIYIFGAALKAAQNAAATLALATNVANPDVEAPAVVKSTLLPSAAARPSPCQEAEANAVCDDQVITTFLGNLAVEDGDGDATIIAAFPGNPDSTNPTMIQSTQPADAGPPGAPVRGAPTPRHDDPAVQLAAANADEVLAADNAVNADAHACSCASSPAVEPTAPGSAKSVANGATTSIVEVVNAHTVVLYATTTPANKTAVNQAAGAAAAPAADVVPFANNEPAVADKDASAAGDAPHPAVNSPKEYGAAIHAARHTETNTAKNAVKGAANTLLHARAATNNAIGDASLPWGLAIDDPALVESSQVWHLADVPHEANQALEAPHPLALSAPQATIFAATGGPRPRSQSDTPAALPPLLPDLTSKPSQPPMSLFYCSPTTHVPLIGGAFADNSQIITQSPFLSTLDFFDAYTATAHLLPLPPVHTYPHHQLLPSNPHITLSEPPIPLLDKL